LAARAAKIVSTEKTALRGALCAPLYVALLLELLLEHQAQRRAVFRLAT
jgi:hypothetical protein